MGGLESDTTATTDVTAVYDLFNAENRATHAAWLVTTGCQFHW